MDCDVRNAPISLTVAESTPTLERAVQPERSSERLPALDGIRGLAIIWVVLHNTTDLLPPALHGASHVLAFLVHLGWIGVGLFFALSGFLITGSLLDTQRASNYFHVFYARRALRILPLYYTVLILLLIIAPALHNGPTLLRATLPEQLSLWLFIVNWTHSAPYGFGHFWSLAVEEQFYIFWPFIVHRLIGAASLYDMSLHRHDSHSLSAASWYSAARTAGPYIQQRLRAWMHSHSAAQAHVFCEFRRRVNGSLLDSQQ